MSHSLLLVTKLGVETKYAGSGLYTFKHVDLKL